MHDSYKTSQVITYFLIFFIYHSYLYNRGLVAIDILRHIEKEMGQPIHELFDLVCGVSTGAIVAVLIGKLSKSLFLHIYYFYKYSVMY